MPMWRVQCVKIFAYSKHGFILPKLIRVKSPQLIEGCSYSFIE